MKFIASFERLLVDHVNLNKTRVGVANDGFATVMKFLRTNEVFGPLFIETSPQGSLRQQTIIKPQGGRAEFDVDILFRLKMVQGWQAKDYLENLHQEFAKTDRYKDIVDRRGKTRCVTLDYESDFHIDIVASIQSGGQSYVMNRATNAYEVTDGDGYAAWFEGRTAITGGSHLVHVVRLVKYTRDCGGWNVKSIVLTTLLAQQIRDQDDLTVYADLPTTLSVLASRLDDLLQSHPDVFDVINPALPAENFNRHLDQEAYRKFRRQFHQWNQSVQRAFSAPGVDEALEAWQEAFGDEFELAENDVATAFGAVPVYPALEAPYAEPLTKICSSEKPTNSVRIDAYLYSANGKTKFRGLNSPAGVLSGVALKYQASTNAKGVYEVWWRVVNTGKYALQDGALRGNFFKAKLLKGGSSSNPLINWESTRYTGHHWIECFIVQSGVCVAKAKFDVNIRNPEQP